MHNHQSMIGVFDFEKQKSHIKETKEHIFPMLKAAKKEWVQQEPAFTNVKYVLQIQIEFVKTLND